MSKTKFVLLFLFLFSIISAPAFAQLPINLNVTYPSPFGTTELHFDGLACSNSSGNMYCYVLIDDDSNNILVDRFNATWGDKQTCDTGQAGLQWNSAGFGVLNSTHVISRERAYGSSTQQYAAINVSDMASCTWTGVFYNGTSAGVTTYPQRHCGYYDDTADGTSGWLYCGRTDGIRNGTDYNQTLAVPFWATSTIESLRLPDQTNNTSIYATYEDLVFYYEDGVYNETLSELMIAYDTETVVRMWDLWKINDTTTWIYFGTFPTGATDYLIRANFSDFLALSGGSNIVPIYPISNETITDPTPEFHTIIYTAYNGTVSWYVNGLFNQNTSLITDGTSVDSYYTYTGELTDGNHNWSAIFFDTEGYNWTTGTQTFILTGSGTFYTGDEATEELTEWVNESFGSSYGVWIISLITASFCGGVLWWEDKDKKLTTFIIPFMIALGVFSLIGMFPSWFLLLQATMIALMIFFKVKDG